MSKIKQFKIARRLGVALFPKCENPKFSLAPKSRGKGRKFSQRSEYGTQLLEKQKARFSYGMQEKQFSNYVKKAMSKKGAKATDVLYTLLETRLDNVVYRLGLARTRRLARQMVSHGHIVVNGRKVTIPSIHVRKGDVIAIRKESQAKTLFANISEKLKDHKTPAWLSFNEKKKEGKVEGVPTLSDRTDAIFDPTAVIEFYSR